MRQCRKERNELLEKLKVRLGELKRKGESGVASQNLTRPKKMKREVVKKVAKAPPKEKDLETTREREGRVKFYSITAGYGFLAEEGVRDYFFHHTQIDDEGKALGTGDRVSFIAKTSPKGWQAVEVRRAK